MIEYLMVIFGLAFLYHGANWLVDGSSSLAKRYGVSSLVIGLTIVAFGTSLPELTVNIFASMRGSAEVSYGNIIGSNIFNILFILGLAAVITPLAVRKSVVWRDIPFAMLAVLIFFFMSNKARFFSGANDVLTRIDGIVMLIFFTGFLWYIYLLIRDGAKHNHHIKTASQKPLLKIAMLIIGGLAVLFIGGKITVDGAVAVARQLGISELLISATIVAAGTSLPELVTSVVAALRKEMDISVGNIIGSNIFNIFFVIGVSAVIAPLTVPSGINFDFLVLAITTLLLFAFMFTGARYKLDRWKGVVFLLFYAAYTAIIIMRG